MGRSRGDSGSGLPRVGCAAIYAADAVWRGHRPDRVVRLRGIYAASGPERHALGQFGCHRGLVTRGDLQPAGPKNEAWFRAHFGRNAVLLLYRRRWRPDGVTLHGADVEFKDGGTGGQTSLHADALPQGRAGSAPGRIWISGRRPTRRSMAAGRRYESEDAGIGRSARA